MPTQNEVITDNTMADYTIFLKLFGSLDAACEAADLNSESSIGCIDTSVYSKDQLIKQLQDKAKELGRTPKQEEIKMPDSGTATSETFRKFFGSYTAACKAAGLKPRQKTDLKYSSKEELVEQLQSKAKALGRTPSCKEVDADKTMACITTFRKVFGSWIDACKAASLKPNPSGRQTGNQA